MSVTEQQIKVRAFDGGTFDALYVSDSVRRPVIVLIQEIFGINDNMRQTASHIASQGYAVCAPDLFWRLEPGVCLDPAIDEQRQHAMRLNQAFDEAVGLRDLAATVELMRTSHPKVGSVGFCLGGRLAYLLAVSGIADCNVGFYGVGIENRLGPTHALTTPVLLHIAGQDHLCPATAQAQIVDGLANDQLANVYVYPDAGHGFARFGSSAHHAESANIAWKRTFSFIARHLLPSG